MITPEEPLPTLPPADPVLALIERAARDPTVDIGKMEGLFALRERMEDRRAKAAFDNAIALAKGKIGPIVKRRQVDFETSRGRTAYRYEDFASIAAVIDPVLAEHGLSYRFRSEQTGPRLKVICRITHQDGYGEDTALEAANDSSGGKNDAQALGSTCTYLQRYTIKLALGLAASNDDDGRGGKGGEDPSIDADQAAFIEQELAATNSDKPKFLALFGAESVEAMTVAQFKRACELLATKKAKSNV